MYLVANIIKHAYGDGMAGEGLLCLGEGEGTAGDLQQIGTQCNRWV